MVLTKATMNQVTVGKSVHFKLQTAPGSRGGYDPGKVGKRRARMRCRFKKCKKKTTYYCSGCEVFICENYFDLLDHANPPKPYKKWGPLGPLFGDDTDDEVVEKEA